MQAALPVLGEDSLAPHLERIRELIDQADAVRATAQETRHHIEEQYNHKVGGCHN
jgi:hypothetical protein